MDQPVLKMRNITKSFPGVVALKGVDFDLLRGEVHALVGENGAGKSTLIKILSGAISKSSGDIYLNNARVDVTNPVLARSLGIAVIYQELMLAPTLSVAENIFLGRFPLKNKALIDKKRLHQKATELLSILGMNIDPKTPVELLTIAQRQMVEVAKALGLNARIIVMDEPSAVLSPHELERLFEVIATLKKGGVSVIYISHRLEEIFRIADRVTVLRDGVVQGTRAIGDLDRDQIINLMVGRKISVVHERSTPKKNDTVVLEVQNLLTEYLRQPICLKLYQGEILGVAGLVGAGRSQLIRAIFGADRKLSGQLFIHGKLANIHSPADAIRYGLGLVPEDRKTQGLFMDLSTTENITITNLRAITSKGFINRKTEATTANSLVQQLKIRVRSIYQHVASLSGGNQQKVILARWLDSNARIIFFDEPTRGIDVAAKAQIHKLMQQLIQQGASIMMISSELPEILEMSDRIIVMREGKITGELNRAEATEEKIISLATQ